MIKYTFKRIAYMLLTLFVIASVTFFLMKLLPGTPFNNQEKMTSFQRELISAKYGLNEPVAVQYVHYLSNLIRGDWGISFQFGNQPVSGLIMGQIGPSMQLGIQALVFGSILGTALGCISAVFQNTWLDGLGTFIAIIGKSIPSFVFAALLQLFLAVKFPIFPVAFWYGPSYTVLPTIALMMFPLAISARFMRTEMIDVLESDYILLAKAKGNSQLWVTIRHALRNAVIPLITILGPLAVSLMTGSMVIEQIFAIPGIGEQFVKSIQVDDYAMIMGTTLLYSGLLVLIIFIVDILYGFIDPRIRIAGGEKK